MKKRIVSMLLACAIVVASGCTQATVPADTGSVSSDAGDQGSENTTENASEEAAESASEEPGVLDISDDAVLKGLPTSWDLTELYADEDTFEADMKRVEELIPEIEKLRGTLNSVEGILNSLEAPEILEITNILNRAGLYTSLQNSLDSTDPWATKASARYKEVSQRVTLACSFMEPELMAMPLKERQEILSDERLAPYAYCMRKYTDPDHVALSEEASTVATLLSNAHNNSATHDVFDYVEVPKPSFTYPDGSEGVLTDSSYSAVINSKAYDHAFRKELFELRNSMRQPYAYTYASLLEGQLRYYWAAAQIDGYDSSLKAALARSDVEPEIYDKLIAFAHRLLPKVHEYYAARQKLLGLEDEMMLCDLGIPVTDYTPKQVTYEYAVNTGREGISAWGDEYLGVFDRIISSPHIDVYPTDTKETGAYENLIGTETTPFVLFNFDGTEDYTSTIVHEMGHAVYSELSAENQNIYNYSPVIFTQEVTSTVNELMLFEHQIDNADTQEEKLFWLDREIDLFLGTLFRQCMYSEFEDYCYKTIENGGGLDAAEMAGKWIELQKLYYGDNMTIPESSGIDWARVPHFYYNYYVFQYATSITYAASIATLVKEKGQDEIDAYMDFLKAGQTASPSKLLGIAGVDPLDDATYDEAGVLIGGLIDEFIAAAK